MSRPWFVAAVVLIVVWIVVRLTGILLRGRPERKQRDRMAMEVRSRLEAVAAMTGGAVVDGPALRTAEGELVLIPDALSSGLTIDATRLVATVACEHQLSIVHEQDVAKALHFRTLRPVTLDDPAVTGDYRVTASDEVFARAVVTPELMEKFRVLEAARVRARFLLARGAATFLTRGIAEPSELKAFHDGCAAVVAHLRMKLSSPSPGAQPTA